MRLRDKVAVVTGGGRGIGRTIAIALAREGADVVVTARSQEQIESAAAEIRELGRNAVALTADLSQRAAIAPYVQQVFSHFPKVHILVNDAGVGSSQNPKPIVEYDDWFWDLSLFVNLTVPYLLMKAFLPNMISEGWGRVINISSAAGKKGFAYGGAYSASKHGLIGLTRSAALEVGTTGVTVNAICPGPVRTAMMLKRLEFDAKRRGTSVEELEKSLSPIQRLLEPKEVAALAVYLCSDEAGGMTGQSLTISGGMLMY